MLEISRYITKIILLICAGLMLTACNPIDTRSKMTKFDDTFHEYTKHLRWGHFRKLTSFMTEEYQPSALEKINSLKNIHISRITSTDWQSNETGDRLTGMIEVDYYVSDRALVRQTQQQQVWLYDEEGKFWQLDAGLPELLTE